MKQLMEQLQQRATVVKPLDIEGQIYGPLSANPRAFDALAAVIAALGTTVEIRPYTLAPEAANSTARERAAWLTTHGATAFYAVVVPRQLVPHVVPALAASENPPDALDVELRLSLYGKVALVINGPDVPQSTPPAQSTPAQSTVDVEKILDIIQ